MRNRWGVEIKKGHWVFATGPRGGRIEGRVASIDRTSSMAKAYGAQITLDSGQTIGADDVSQTLGPMTLDDDGTVRQNPLTRVRIKSPPQRPAGNSSAPSKRLMKRRKVTAKAPKGVYANPVPVVKTKATANFPFLVQVKNTENWNTSAAFKTKSEAVLFGEALAEKHPRLPIRVYWHTGGPMK